LPPALPARDRRLQGRRPPARAAVRRGRGPRGGLPAARPSLAPPRRGPDTNRCRSGERLLAARGADDDPHVAGAGVGRSLSSERVGLVLDAYAELAHGNAEPLVALLDGNVEWLEWTGIREGRRLVGAESVARILRSCADDPGRLECTGAAKVGTDSV